MNAVQAQQKILAILREGGQMCHQDIQAKFWPDERLLMSSGVERLMDLGLIELNVGGLYRSLEAAADGAQAPIETPERADMKTIQTTPQKGLGKSRKRANLNFSRITELMESQGNVGFTIAELRRHLTEINPCTLGSLAYAKVDAGQLIKIGAKFYLPDNAVAENEVQPVVVETNEEEVPLESTVRGQNHFTINGEGVGATQAAQGKNNSTQGDCEPVSKSKAHPFIVVKNNSQACGTMLPFVPKSKSSLPELYQDLDCLKCGFDAGVTLSGGIQIKKNGVILTLDKPELELVVALVNKAMV